MPESTTSSMFERVCEFHQRFGVPVRSMPMSLPDDELEFRRRFIDEELEEYDRAVTSGDLTKQFDSLLDLVYVVLGTMAMQGFPADEGFVLVHHANMQKRLATSIFDSATASGRAHRFDVVKPEGWQSPDASLHRLLCEQTVRAVEAQSVEQLPLSDNGPV